MTENEKNLRDLEEWFKMNPTEVAAYEFQKKLLEEEMAREAEQAQAATVGTAPIRQEATPPPIQQADELPADKKNTFDEAMSHFEEGNYDEAIPLFKELAESGYAKAMNYLGMCYEEDYEYTKAIEWYSKASEKGCAEANDNIGLLYAKGNKVVAQDYAKAVEWYSKGAEQGNADALNHLAWCYHDGNGVKKDETKALELFRKAAAKDHTRAKSMVKTLEGNEEAD